jgi:hypothetical protein
VIVLPWHNPVLLAEQAATVDLLSGGRLDFGIGKGYRHNEFASFRIPMEEAGARFEESIDIITKSWTSNERFSFHGKYWQFDDIIVEPPTNQKPHPPLWQGAGHAESIRKVAAHGHNLLLDQFASIDETINRFNTYKAAMLANGFGFDPSQALGRSRLLRCRHPGGKGGGDRAADGRTETPARDQPAAGWQQHRQHHGVFRHARSQRGSHAVRHAGRDLPQAGTAAGGRRRIYSAERRRHLAAESSALRQGGMPHFRTGPSSRTAAAE